jgi:hypothetical protein
VIKIDKEFLYVGYYIDDNDNFVLKETLLYLFEKNSLIYLKPNLNNQNVKANQNIESTSLEI